MSSVIMAVYHNGKLLVRRKVRERSILKEASLSLRYINTADRWSSPSSPAKPLSLTDCKIVREYAPSRHVQVCLPQEDDADAFVEVSKEGSTIHDTEIGFK